MTYLFVILQRITVQDGKFLFTGLPVVEFYLKYDIIKLSVNTEGVENTLSLLENMLLIVLSKAANVVLQYFKLLD